MAYWPWQAQQVLRTTPTFKRRLVGLKCVLGAHTLVGRLLGCKVLPVGGLSAERPTLTHGSVGGPDQWLTLGCIRLRVVCKFMRLRFSADVKM